MQITCIIKFLRQVLIAFDVNKYFCSLILKSGGYKMIPF